MNEESLNRWSRREWLKRAGGGAGMVLVGAGEMCRMHGPTVISILIIVLGLVCVVDRVRRAPSS